MLQAILESSEQCLTLCDIYAWFMKNFIYFRDNNPTWKVKLVIVFSSECPYFLCVHCRMPSDTICLYTSALCVLSSARVVGQCGQWMILCTKRRGILKCRYLCVSIMIFMKMIQYSMCCLCVLVCGVGYYFTEKCGWHVG